MITAKRRPDLAFDNNCCFSCGKCVIKNVWMYTVWLDDGDKKAALVFVLGKLLHC